MYFDQNRAKYERWFGIHDWDVLEWRANHVTENAKATWRPCAISIPSFRFIPLEVLPERKSRSGAVQKCLGLCEDHVRDRASSAVSYVWFFSLENVANGISSVF